MKEFFKFYIFIPILTTYYSLYGLQKNAVIDNNKDKKNLAAFVIKNDHLKKPVYIVSVKPEDIELQSSFEQVSEKNFIRTIDYFNKQNENIGRKEINKKDNTIKFFIFHSNKSQTILRYDNDTIIITEFPGENQPFVREVTINKKNEMLQDIQRKHDNSFLVTEYKPDNTKIIYEINRNNKETKRTIYYTDNSSTYYEFYENGKSSLEKNFDTKNKPIYAITWHRDGKYSHSQYFSDETYVTQIFDPQGHCIEQSYTNQHGQTKHFPLKTIVAWHESGHALTSMHLNTMQLLQHITIIPQKNTLGHVQNIYTYHDEQTIDELKNNIIVNIAGAVGEQLLFEQPMFKNIEDLYIYLKNNRYENDMKNITDTIKKLLMKDNLTKSLQFSSIFETQDMQILSMVLDLYQKTYQFLMLKKFNLEIIIEELLKKETLTTEQAYKLAQADIPLMFYEEGPLPLNLINDYQHRGWK